MGGAGDAQILLQQKQARQKAADQQWQKVLDQNKGNPTGTAGFSTDFEAAGGFKGLQKMIENADAGAIMTVSDHWGAVGAALTDAASGLKTHVNNLLEHWSGPSADAFHANALSLHESLSNGSEYAAITQKAMSEASDALATAKSNFPHAPSEWDQIGSALGGSSDIRFKQDAAKYGLEKAVRMDGGDLSAWEQVHQEAVVVMEKLGRSYNASASAMAHTPGAAADIGTWPSKPVVDPAGGITGDGGGAVAPRTSREASLTPITGGDAGGHDGFTPGQNGGSGRFSGGGGVGGVHGGQGDGTPPGIGGTLDGGLGGPKSGAGEGGGPPGGPGFDGITGMARHGGDSHGGDFGGASGVGEFGGPGGGALASESAEGERAGGLSASKRAAVDAEGEGGSVAGEGEPTETGGLGGTGSGKQNKKKRKPRPAYLVEDAETWLPGGAANPDVIVF